MLSLYRYINTGAAFVKSFHFLLVLLFLPLSVYPQFYQVRNFNVESGLPSSDVYNILQDSKGYIWLATDMGVSRYNGVEFQNFSSENGLPDNTIFGFCEDAKARIWFISFSGKLSYFSGDSIYTVPCNQSLEKTIRKTNWLTVSIYVDRFDTIWIGNASKNMLKIAPPWREKDVAWIRIPYRGEYICLLDKKNLIFGGHLADSNFVTVYSRSLKRMQQVNLGAFDPLRSGSKFYSLTLKDGSLIASLGHNLVRLKGDSVISILLDQKERFVSLLEDKDGRIVSASYDGVRIHDPNHLANYETIPDFSNKICTGLLLDREGSLWVTTEGQGLYCIPFRDGRYYNTDHGLTQSKISCMAEKKGIIFTGHLNGSVSVLNGDKIKNISLDLKQSVIMSLTCFFMPNATDIYVSSQLSIYKLAKDWSYSLATQNHGARKFVPVNDGLVITPTNRYILWRDSQGQFLPKKSLSCGQYIDNAFMDRDSTLWICGMSGLLKYKNDSLESMGEKNPLLAARIVDLAEDRAGRLWMTSRGQGVIIKDGAMLYTIHESDGLASNMCRNLFIDSNQVVWVGSNRGLSKIITTSLRPFTYSVSIYTKQDGLLSNDVNYIVGRGRELLLAHNNGISILNPDLLKKNSAAPPVYITHTDMNGKIYRKDSLYLGYDENYLKVNYIGLSFKNPGTVEYKYKMEGLDTAWVYTHYTSAQFQTLNPGTYRFVVYAKNTDGYWSPRPATLYLFILPAWWQTWIVKLLATGLLIGTVYIVVKIRWDIKKKREYEKAVLKYKITTSELKALRAQMNPHFIFNAINSIQHFITSNNPVASQKFLSKFAKLIRYVVDNSKPVSIPLSKEVEALQLFMDLERLRFAERFEYRITLGDNIDATFIEIPSMLIQPYIENSIWHGIMHKEGVGKIDISFELNDQLLKCTVEDNGIGRKRSQEYKLKQDPQSHKSVGMSLTRERLEIINQLNKSQLSIVVTDLMDEEGNAIGTRVELFIPVS